MPAPDEWRSEAMVGLAEAVRFQRDLYLYWREAWAADGLALTARGLVTRPALRRMRARLLAADGIRASDVADAEPTEAEDARLFFLRRLLQRLGLLRGASGDAGLLAAEQAEMARYLAHPLAERLRICARLWVAGGWWPDAPDPRAEPSRLMTPAPPRIALARRRLLDALAAMTPDTIHALPLAPRASTDRRTRTNVRRRTASVPLRATATTDGATERAALLGPLAWLGFAVVEETQVEGVRASVYRAGVAVQALRAAEEEGAALALPEATGRVVLSPDFTLVAYPPLTAPELLLLDACADEEAIELTARYRLSRSAFARARALGWNADEVARRLAALAGASGSPTGGLFPANVRVTLDDWERHVERLRLTRDARVVTTRTAETLDALLADPRARQWVERRLAPTAALLVRAGVAPVRAWLLRHGGLPAVSEG